jgi:hypothetical protein
MEDMKPPDDAPRCASVLSRAMRDMLDENKAFQFIAPII